MKTILKQLFYTISQEREKRLLIKMKHWTKSRTEVIEILKELQEDGYTHVVRDKDKHFLICFSQKPKRYRDTEMWGYVNPDESGVLMAHPIKNEDITEIQYNNRLATLISDFIDSDNFTN